MPRMDDLLAAAAQRFDDGGSPFEHDWLSRHNVTLEECYVLSEQIALAIKVYQVVVTKGLKGHYADREIAGLILADVLREEVKAGAEAPRGVDRIMEATIRSFIAVRAYGQADMELKSTRKRLSGILPPEVTKWEGGDYHLTLRFLGDVTKAQLRLVRAALPGCAEQHRWLKLELGGMGMFPEAWPPKVAWVGLAGDVAALRQLQADIDKLVTRELGIQAEYPFSPHVTLARFGDMSKEQGARGPARHSGLQRARCGDLGRRAG